MFLTARSPCPLELTLLFCLFTSSNLAKVESFQKTCMSQWKLVSSITIGVKRIFTRGNGHCDKQYIVAANTSCRLPVVAVLSDLDPDVPRTLQNRAGCTAPEKLHITFQVGKGSSVRAASDRVRTGKDGVESRRHGRRLRTKIEFNWLNLSL
jgi:hypothetical protein